MDELGSIDGVPIKPCIRCGYCCREARCALSIMVAAGISSGDLPEWPDALLDSRVVAELVVGKVLGVPCPFLEKKEDGRYSCWLLHPDSPVDEKMVREWLCIGEGCPSALNSDRRALDKKLRGDVSSDPTDECSSTVEGS